MRRLLKLGLFVICALHVVAAQADPVKVLWIDSLANDPEVKASHRRTMVSYLNNLEGGAVFDVTYLKQSSAGTAAGIIGASNPLVIVVDSGNPRGQYNAADLDAFQRHYASGKRTVMLDGSLVIRSTGYTAETRFPGVNASAAAFLVNQILAIADNGGGILIGSDHDRYQADANQVANALIPGAGFRGTTDPSTDGDFIGDEVLNRAMPVIPIDMFRHWASIPSQGEVSVGTFTDFTGQPVELFALVEAADKPGGGRKRPYISASFNPGSKRYAIDSNEAIPDNMPTRYRPPQD